MAVAESERRTVSFVVPCYNERNNIANAIQEIEWAAAEAKVADFEILVVDDCSTDGTGAAVTALAKAKPYVKLVSNKRNLGFGGAYKEGVKHASCNYVIMVPGDNSHPADGITPILLKAGEADIVIPYTANPEARTWQRRLVSGAFTFLVNWLFGLKVPYFNGLVLHRVDLLRRIEIETDSFAYQAEALVKLITGGATYCAVPVMISERDTGTSSAFKPKNVYRVIKAIILLKRDFSSRALGPVKDNASSSGLSQSEKLRAG